MLDIGRSQIVWVVAFHPDGKHLLGGYDDGIRRWRVSDGQEVGKQTRAGVIAISVSSDQRWMVCGTFNGACVWDGDMQEKIIDVEGQIGVYSVDVSPDSTRFATGTRGEEASIWSITSGERLVGPLKHYHTITGIRFSPNGERIATACLENSIRIFDSHTGDKLVTIKIDIPRWIAATPLAWSSDAQEILAASDFDNKIRSFSTSTGSLLTESQTLHDDENIDVHSVALAANGKFLVTFAGNFISFLNMSTLNRNEPVVDDGQCWLCSIAISADSSLLATGQADGKIVIRDLSKILPDVYGPFHVSIRTSIIWACR